MIVDSKNIEFGYELISVLPYAYYLHSKGELTKTISGNDTECLYYFSPDHEINPEQRSWFNTPEVNTPNITIHRNTLDTKEFLIPPYKEIYKNKEFKFKKETVVICNRHNIEWNDKPINYFDIPTLEKLFKLLQDKYQVVYINVEGRKELYDNAPPISFGDYDLLKKYPKVINFHDLIKPGVSKAVLAKLDMKGPYNSWNETQLKLFANCEKYITMNGGHAILSAYFGGENIVMSKRGKPEAKEIHKSINSFYRWYREFGNQRIVHVENETKLIDQVKSQWVDEDPVINILVRTSGRPNYFKECIKSIQEQDYKNINIWVSIDNGDKYTFKYPVYPINIKKENIEISENDRIKHGRVLPFNIYFNEMYKHIKEGLIMYLDDDDKLNDKNALKEIAKEYKKGNELIFWRADVGGKIVPPDELWKKEPKIFNISGIGFAFDSKYKDLAKWTPFKRGDFRVANKLYHGIKKQAWINKILASTQEGSHAGMNIDKIINNQKNEVMETKIEVKIINDKFKGQKTKHKIGETKKVLSQVAKQLIAHGLAEEVGVKKVKIVKKVNKVVNPIKKNKAIRFK